MVYIHFYIYIILCGRHNWIYSNSVSIVLWMRMRTRSVCERAIQCVLRVGRRTRRSSWPRIILCTSLLTWFRRHDFVHNRGLLITLCTNLLHNPCLKQHEVVQRVRFTHTLCNGFTQIYYTLIYSVRENGPLTLEYRTRKNIVLKIAYNNLTLKKIL